MIPWLDPTSLHFPSPSSALAEPNGLLAAGGDLSPQRLMSAYRSGIFPWYSDGEPILWWSPAPRCVIDPHHFHCSRSLRRRLKRNDYQATFDQAFREVLLACAAPREHDAGTWITAEMQHAYLELHRLGIAHSVEVWRQDELIGGLYGIALGRVFFGESMFSAQANGSKIAIAKLCQRLCENGYLLLDCQVYSEHLASLGAFCLSRNDFTRLLDQHAHAEIADHWPSDSNCTETTP